MLQGNDDTKRAILKVIADLYDDIEAGKAFVTSMNVDNDHQEVTRVGDNWAKYIPTGRQTISLEIERNV